jgi:hypothetical protein
MMPNPTPSGGQISQQPIHPLQRRQPSQHGNGLAQRQPKSADIVWLYIYDALKRHSYKEAARSLYNSLREDQVSFVSNTESTEELPDVSLEGPDNLLLEWFPLMRDLWSANMSGNGSAEANAVWQNYQVGLQGSRFKPFRI